MLFSIIRGTPTQTCETFVRTTSTDISCSDLISNSSSGTFSHTLVKVSITQVYKLYARTASTARHCVPALNTLFNYTNMVFYRLVKDWQILAGFRAGTGFFGTLSHTLVKSTSTLNNPIASHCVPALNTLFNYSKMIFCRLVKDWQILAGFGAGPGSSPFLLTSLLWEP